MPKSRGRKTNLKPQRPFVPVARSGGSSTSPVPSKRWRTKAKAIWSAVSVGAVLLAYLVLVPRISITPSAVPQPSDPFSGYFRLANNQFYSLRDVSIQASMWCAAIGGRDSNPPPIDNAHCLPSMKTSKPEWRDHTIDGDESWDISLAGLFSVTPSSALRYADIVITVNYQLWLWPFHRCRREFRFFTRRLDGGGVEWLQKPLDEDQVPTHI